AGLGVAAAQADLNALEGSLTERCSPERLAGELLIEPLRQLDVGNLDGRLALLGRGGGGAIGGCDRRWGAAPERRPPGTAGKGAREEPAKHQHPGAKHK